MRSSVPAARPLEIVLNGPHTAASIAAALAVCDHPHASRVPFVSCDPSGAQTRVTWCACCGAAAHTDLGALPAAGDFIRTTLAQLVTAEQLVAVEVLALGLRELEHSLETLGAHGAIERSRRSAFAAIADAVRSFARSAALAGADRLTTAAARLVREESSSTSVGW